MCQEGVPGTQAKVVRAEETTTLPPSRHHDVGLHPYIISYSTLACSRLRDGGGKSFSRARLIFALLVLIRSHYTI